MQMSEFQSRVRDVIKNPNLSYHQRRHYLAALAEEALPYPELSEEAAKALAEGVVNDLFEGPAPYRARYILPDYAKALKNGSEFLELEPAQNIDEAINNLLILYNHVPSITGFPVYLGDIDKLLEPYVDGLSDEELYNKMKLFWIAIDRMLPDGFVHTNLGPVDSRVSRTIFKIERELEQVVPNISLKVDPELSSDDFIKDAVETVFESAKPHFINHPMMVNDLGEDYAAVSCYNSLKIGGGSHTLIRLNLKEVALRHVGDIESFFAETLPHYAEMNAQVMEARIRYLVEETPFFETDFLVREGLISLDRFSAMYGLFGLSECVNTLMAAQGKNMKYGKDKEANQLSYRIVSFLADWVKERPMPYCEGFAGRAVLHSQSGIDIDVDVSAGTRIPIGEEPEMFEHIATVAPHHIHFSAGVSDIFHVEDTARRNPMAMVNIIRGAFKQGMRDFTFNLSTNGFIRVTGYLVRKSDLEEFKTRGSRLNSTVFADGSQDNQVMTNRKLKRVLTLERQPVLK